MSSHESDEDQEQLHEQATGIRFLLTNEAGEPFRRTQCWIRREPGLSMNDWSLHLTRPEGDAIAINDLKQWALFQSQEHRFFDDGFQHLKGQDLRRFHRDEVLEQYLRAVKDALPAAKQASRMWCLIPSVGDVARRRRYRSVIQKALPGVMILHEPEMVVEYFRLVRRELTLEDNKSSVFLVIDAGASTCNMTFVLTRKDKKVVDASAGIARKSSLRAKQGDAADTAGRWVDEEIGRILGLQARLRSFTPAGRDEALRAIEAAKIEATRTGHALIEHAALGGEHFIDRDTLVRAAEHLWDRLVPVYRSVAEQFLSDVTQGADAAYFRERLAGRGVNDADSVHRLVDGVILAGGTSRLPGFQEEMFARILPESNGIVVHTVGNDYSIAAATGALAHVLHQHHKPSRLTAAPESDDDDSLANAIFHGTPVTDIFFAWKRKSGREQKVLVLDRDDPLVQTGGRRLVEGVPAFETGDKFMGRLLPGDEYSFVGLKLHEIEVTDAPGRMSLVWDASLSEASVESEQLRRVHQLHLALTNLWPDPIVPSTTQRPPEVRLWTDGTADVVIDLGMSKTVVMSAEAGPFVLPVPAARTVEVRAVPARPTLDVVPYVEVPIHSPTPTSLASTVVLPVNARVVTAQVTLIEGGGAAQEAAIVPLRPLPAPIEDVGPTLSASLAPLLDAGLQVTVANLTMLVLALSVRPFVLLAGPPGCGKSTLVRMLARMLGLEDDRDFFEITVQPHWRTEKAIPLEARRAWESRSLDEQRLFLFDEINLARPEQYLMPFFRRLDRQQGTGPLRACGTLNIDDASRPPSPKVIDRSFLMEIEAPRTNVSVSGMQALREWSGGALTRLPDGGALIPEEMSLQMVETLRVIRSCVVDNHLREDLLPSHRDEIDLGKISAAYRHARIPRELLSEDELVDRALAGRVLVKLAGAGEQVRPLIEALDKHFLKHPTLVRCQRRIALARRQIDQFGFVAPWQ